MATQILLGPQSPVPNLRRAIEILQPEAPVVAITAGWRDSEGEIDELREIAGCDVEDLMLYHRAEQVFAHEPVLRGLQRDRQDKLTELQRLALLRIEGFGWRLHFIRRPLFQDPVAVVVDGAGQKIGVLEEDGRINMDPDIKVRK